LRLWLRECLPAAENLLGRFHVVAILLATPLGMLAARRNNSGRIRVIAVKVPDPDAANPIEVYQPDG